jgi:hypothetical protein
MAVFTSRCYIQNVANPTGTQKVNSPTALCVSTRGGRHGMNRPKSGTMLPMMVAESMRHLARGREKGNTTAA